MCHKNLRHVEAQNRGWSGYRNFLVQSEISCSFAILLHLEFNVDLLLSKKLPEYQNFKKLPENALQRFFEDWLLIFVFLCSWAIWLTTLSINGNILRTPCAQYGNFSIIRQGFILAGSTLQTFENLIIQACEFECILRQNCRSINTKSGSGVNCQLVSKSIDFPFDEATLSPQPGWSYRTTNYSEKNVSCAREQVDS